MSTALYEMTCKVVGHGYEMVVTLAPFDVPPTPERQALFRADCEDSYARIYREAHQTSAVTVGPHDPEGDDDGSVG